MAQNTDELWSVTEISNHEENWNPPEHNPPEINNLQLSQISIIEYLRVSNIVC